MSALVELFAREDWQQDALCAQTDPEAFFPEKGGSTRQAKNVCLSCDVRGECLAYALENGERFGIWGGLSERERRNLKKKNEDAQVGATVSTLSRERANTATGGTQPAEVTRGSRRSPNRKAS